MKTSQTAIITGGSQGIGAGLVQGFLAQGYNVVATSRRITDAPSLDRHPRLALVDGHIGDAATADAVLETALDAFGSVDVLVNNAGIFISKPFTDYTTDDYRRLVATNLDGFFHLTQRAVRRMLEQKTGGSVTTITSSLVNHPIAGLAASVPMVTKGGLESATKNLAIEYAKAGIRFNAVSPGAVDTPLHRDNSADFLRTLSPMGRIADVEEIVAAVLYLTAAKGVTGEVLHVDGGAHLGTW